MLYIFCLNLVRNNSSSYDHESDNQESNEKFVVTYCFFRGLLFLEAQHSLVISYTTLLRRLEQYGLYRRGKNIHYKNLRLTYQKLRKLSTGQELVIELSVGQEVVSGGYRTVWHTLETKVVI